MLRKQILDILEENARLSDKEIATMLNISVEELAKNIREMENEKIIIKYTTIINKDILPETSTLVEAFIEVKVKPIRDRGFDSIAERIYSFQEVRSLYLMSGGYDLLVVIAGQTLKEIASFVSKKLSTIDNVQSTRTHFLLKKYKENGNDFNGNTNERLAISP